MTKGTLLHELRDLPDSCVLEFLHSSEGVVLTTVLSVYTKEGDIDGSLQEQRQKMKKVFVDLA